MGLLLSVLVTYIGVVEVLNIASYVGGKITSTNYGKLPHIHQHYVGKLQTHRTEIYDMLEGKLHPEDIVPKCTLVWRDEFAAIEMDRIAVAQLKMPRKSNLDMPEEINRKMDSVLSNDTHFSSIFHVDDDSGNLKEKLPMLNTSLIQDNTLETSVHLALLTHSPSPDVSLRNTPNVNEKLLTTTHMDPVNSILSNSDQNTTKLVASNEEVLEKSNNRNLDGSLGTFNSEEKESELNKLQHREVVTENDGSSFYANHKTDINHNIICESSDENWIGQMTNLINTKLESDTDSDHISHNDIDKTENNEIVTTTTDNTVVSEDLNSHRQNDTSLTSNSKIETSHSNVMKVEQKRKEPEAFWLIFSAEFTKAANKDWHGQHFCCWQCDESLTGQRYVLRDDHPYCVSCYESVFANNCEKCSRTIGIESKDLSYKDKHWHEACFLCTTCGDSLVDKQFGSKGDRIYCGRCYDEQFASRCDGCHEVFRADTASALASELKTRLTLQTKNTGEERIKKAKDSDEDVAILSTELSNENKKFKCSAGRDCFMGDANSIASGTKKMEYKTRQWHEKCFCCCVCKVPIGTQSFIPREQEIYCAKCYEEKYATRCIKCNKVITSGGVTYRNEPWHRECFTCTHCSRSLAGERFTSRDDKPYCADCFGELFAKRCFACKKPITGIGGTKFISFEDRHWHNDCFFCALCQTSLVGRGFITDQDDIICPECAKQKLM